MFIDVVDPPHGKVDEIEFYIDDHSCWLCITLSSGREIMLTFRDYAEALKFRSKLECIVDAAPKLRDAIDGKPVSVKR